MVVKRIFLDTNIVADMIDPLREHHADAMRLLEMCVVHDTQMVISEDMVSTLFYISSDKEATLSFLEHVVFVDWEVVPFGQEVLREAVRHSLQKGIDLEDTLQCLCAREHGCTLIVTEDRGFVTCGVEMTDYKGVLL
jgi:predicted nucleic acid-binding protein